MRRIWNLAAVLLLLGCLCLNVCAAEDALTMTGADVQTGQTVYLTVTLNENVTGDTMGITYTYDDQLLKVIPQECRWRAGGVLQDFSSANQNGVWAASKRQNLQGEVCVLVFQPLTGEIFSDAVVECELLIKDGPNEAGRYGATAAVSVVCSHSYGPWEQIGEALHSRSCATCGANQSQSHSWDQGIQEADPEYPGYDRVVSTCSLCGGTKVERVQGALEEVRPQIPDMTKPTQPEQAPQAPTVETMPMPTLPQPTDPVPKPEEPERPTVPTEPTVPAEQVKPAKPAKPTKPTKPALSSGEQQKQESTEPSVYVPRDYNKPQETQPRKEQAEGHSSVQTTQPESSQNQTIVKKDKIPDKVRKPASTVKKPAETQPIPAENLQPEQPESRSNRPVLLIAAVSILLMAAVVYMEKKK